MREGIRRLAVVIKTLSWLWIGLFMAYALWAQITGDYPEPILDRLILTAFVLAPALIGLGVAWILEGFAIPDDPRRERSP